MFRKTSIALWLLGLCLGTLCLSTLCVTAQAQTPGGTVLSNQAGSSYSFAGEVQPSETSNRVDTTIPSACSLVVSPGGSVTAPGQNMFTVPGTTVYLPYTLTNTGNQTLDFDVAARLEPSAVKPLSLAIISDLNGNGVDDGEPVINNLSLARNNTGHLLLKVVIPSDASLSGLIYINLIAVCAGNPAIRDEDNVSSIEVLEGGIIGLTKTATPASGSSVTPGQSVSYDISFSANERTLTNVLIRDVLDSHLANPSLVLTVNGATVAGASYDAATRTVSATLTTLQPGDDVVLTIVSSVLSDTPGAVIIRNRATVSVDGGTFETNETNHATPASCAVNISPSGNVSSPAYQKTALPGDTLALAYTLTNLGNVTNDFEVATTLINSDFVPAVSLVFDANNNGAVDTGESVITRVDDIPAGGSVPLLLVIKVDELVQAGQAFINISTHCQFDPTIRDDDNVAQITVPLGGLSNLSKRAEPVAGTTLFPGSAVTYIIEFVANGRKLNNITVSDPLGNILTAPSRFSSGTITDSVSGLSAEVIGAYDALTRTLTWNFATIPAGMRVRLEFTAQVRNDITIAPNIEIRNVATVSEGDNSPLTTNPVTHPLAPLEILLQKTATPNQVLIGETLSYTLKVTNPSESVNIETLELTDDLPDVLRYQADTSVLTLPSGTEQSLEPTVTGQKLVWTLPRLEPGQTIRVTFGTTVLANALDVDEIINTASVVASDANGRAVADAAAAANTTIDKKPFTTTSVLLGTVFVDNNANNTFEQESDEGVEGVRLYLSDGRSVITDKFGRYTFLNLIPGSEALKVDNTTLPARLLQETISENKPGLWRVRLEPGLIIRQDIPLQPPGAQLSVEQFLNVSRGPITIQKHLVRNQTESKMIMDITSSEALHNVVITDALPLTIQKTGTVIASQVVSVNDLRFELGDIPAGYVLRLEYPIIINGGLKGALIAPTIEWSVR
jgi:fimbrial isopeptide formation D2 family protein